MRYILTAPLFCAVAFVALPVVIFAQSVVPDAGRVPNSYHYVPPPPWKSVEIGNFYFHRKDYRGALSRYKEATQDDPYYAPAYLGLGKVYEKLGKRHEALINYRKYLNTLPSQKQADDATGVHKAIRRLERQLRQEKKPPQAAKATRLAGKN